MDKLIRKLEEISEYLYEQGYDSGITQVSLDSDVFQELHSHFRKQCMYSGFYRNTGSSQLGLMTVHGEIKIKEDPSKLIAEKKKQIQELEEQVASLEKLR